MQYHAPTNQFTISADDMKRIPYPIYATRQPSPTITPPMWWMLAGVVIAGPVAYLITLAVTGG